MHHRRSTGSRDREREQEAWAADLRAYRTQIQQERELEAVQGLQELGEGLVQTVVRALPAPNAPPRAPVDQGRQLDNMLEGRYYVGLEYVLPAMVPPRLVPEIKAASALCRIKRGLQKMVQKVKGKGKEKK